MTREEARQIMSTWLLSSKGTKGQRGYIEGWFDEEDAEAFRMAIEALSADATKKKAELKDNGDWDCPDVYCDECDHHRSVEWCSLAIPNREEIDDTYKMVTEAFFEGFESAEKRYRFLIETVEELDKKLADAVSVVRCKDCRWWSCKESLHQHNSHLCRYWKSTNTSADDFCSYGERREE